MRAFSSALSNRANTSALASNGSRAASLIRIGDELNSVAQARCASVGAPTCWKTRCADARRRPGLAGGRGNPRVALWLAAAALRSCSANGVGDRGRAPSKFGSIGGCDLQRRVGGHQVQPLRFGVLNQMARLGRRVQDRERA